MREQVPAEEAKKETGRGRNPYRLNLGLFLLLVVGLTIWFRIHLKPVLTETSIVGGTLSLWGIWKVLQDWFFAGTGEGKSSLSQKLLGSRGATEYLLFGIVLFLILVGTTSSVYVVYEGAGPGQSQFSVATLRQGNPYLEPLTVRSHDRTAGRPFFLGLRAKDLEFRVTDPPGYDPIYRKLRPWGAVRIQVPEDFTKTKQTVLRLVPGFGLWNVVPKEEDDPPVKYKAIVQIGDQSVTLDDFRWRTVYTGVPEESLEWIRRGQDDEAFRRVLLEYLTKVGVRPERQQAFLVRWGAEPVRIPSRKAEIGEPVRIDVYRSEASGDSLILTTVATVEERADRIQTIILGESIP
jgi:hypothetical protein